MNNTLFNILTVLSLYTTPLDLEIHPIKAIKHGIHGIYKFHKALKHQNAIYKKLLQADLDLNLGLPIMYVDDVRKDLRQ